MCPQAKNSVQWICYKYFSVCTVQIVQFIIQEFLLAACFCFKNYLQAITVYFDTIYMYAICVWVCVCLCTCMAPVLCICPFLTPCFPVGVLRQWIWKTLLHSVCEYDTPEWYLLTHFEASVLAVGWVQGYSNMLLFVAFSLYFGWTVHAKTSYNVIVAFFTIVPCSLILSKFLCSPTDAQVSCLKKQY